MKPTLIFVLAIRAFFECSDCRIGCESPEWYLPSIVLVKYNLAIYLKKLRRFVTECGERFTLTICQLVQTEFVSMNKCKDSTAVKGFLTEGAIYITIDAAQ